MPRLTAGLAILLAALGGCTVVEVLPQHGRAPKAARGGNVKADDLRFVGAGQTCAGWQVRPTSISRSYPPNSRLATWFHENIASLQKYSTEAMDPEDVVHRGPITVVEVYEGGCITGLRLMYGDRGWGKLRGFDKIVGEGKSQPKGVPKATWEVPAGERITRVEVEVYPNVTDDTKGGVYCARVSRLQFITDKGTQSPRFGKRPGELFTVKDSADGELKTIGVWTIAPPRELGGIRGPSVVGMTFYFDAPCYIKDIHYDLAVLDAARKETAPQVAATQELVNRSSVEQTSEYRHSQKVQRTTTLTFEKSAELKFGRSISAEVEGGFRGLLSAKVATEFHWEVSRTSKSGRAYTSSREEEVSWSIPVKVPPHKKIIARTTWKKYDIKIPFTYTVAWYQGTKDNIVKEVTLPGTYEDTRVEDLRHEFTEAPLE